MARIAALTDRFDQHGKGLFKKKSKKNPGARYIFRNLLIQKMFYNSTKVNSDRTMIAPADFRLDKC